MGVRTRWEKQICAKIEFHPFPRTLSEACSGPLGENHLLQFDAKAQRSPTPIPRAHPETNLGPTGGGNGLGVTLGVHNNKHLGRNWVKHLGHTPG